MKKMKKSQAWAVVIAMIALLALLIYTSAVGFGPTGTGSARNIILGLDLSGGVSITYQVAGEETPTAEDMSDTVYKLQQRVWNYSTEAQVYQEGDNRIAIEIPGVSDANAILEELGQPGSLEFQLEDGTVVLDGSAIKNAQGVSTTDELKNRSYIVELEFTEEGREAFAKATAANVGNVIYIVYDDEVISSPVVETAIDSDSAQITGMDSLEEAQNLASSIRIGSLNVQLEEIRSTVVGAQLGEKAISTSLLAGAIGLLLIIIFMICVYRVPGLVAGFSLIMYTALVLVTLNAFDITLTLEGIAGIVLSIGMAVDANVIIYARIREEISDGMSVKGAIHEGFHKAFSAILDGNVTTLIAAFVLGVMANGSVRGFAYTLAIGIVLSMFTALVISRYLIQALFALGVQDPKFYGHAHPMKPLDFVGKRALTFTIAIVLVLSGPVGMAVHKAVSGSAMNYSLEFLGGTATTVTFNEDYTIEEIDEQIKPVVQKVTGDSNIQAQKVADSYEVIIKTRELSLEEREELYTSLAVTFGVDESLITSESISATVSGELRKNAVLAVLVATICMLIYIWFRFNDIRFACSAVLALCHDVAGVLAYYVLFRASVGNTFIACMLTIVGYSINATIVIFDRIRENRARMSKKDDIKDVVNASITQTLTRSIYTSLTTFVMVAALYVLGVPSIRSFAMPLMVGIVCGAFSSVCVTGPLWYTMQKYFGKREEA